MADMHTAMKDVVSRWWRRNWWVLLLAVFVWVRLWYAGLGCPFRKLTGLPCPFCGMTRGTVNLLRGKLSLALWYNPLVMILPVAAVLLVAMFFSHRLRGFILSRVGPWALLVVMGLLWVVALLFAHP